MTTARQAGGRWELRVQDSGIGISAEALPRIFDSFEQGGVNVTRRFGGLGLGLAICKALVELHRGSIHAESAGPGQGSTFIVELPGEGTDTVSKAPNSAPAESGNQLEMRLLRHRTHYQSPSALCRIYSGHGL